MFSPICCPNFVHEYFSQFEQWKKKTTPYWSKTIFRAATVNFWQTMSPQWRPHHWRATATFFSAKSRQGLDLGALILKHEWPCFFLSLHVEKKSYQILVKLSDKTFFSIIFYKYYIFFRHWRGSRSNRDVS